MAILYRGGRITSHLPPKPLKIALVCCLQSLISVTALKPLHKLEFFLQEFIERNIFNSDWVFRRATLIRLFAEAIRIVKVHEYRIRRSSRLASNANRAFKKHQNCGIHATVTYQYGEFWAHIRTYLSTISANSRMFILFELIRTLEGDYSYG